MPDFYDNIKTCRMQPQSAEAVLAIMKILWSGKAGQRKEEELSE